MKVFSISTLPKFALIPALLISCQNHAEKGIICDQLPHWSKSKPQVNLHHVFCGEINKRDKLTGFHAMPNGIPPSSFVKSKNTSKEDNRGIYSMRGIEMTFDGTKYTKSFSSFFPNHCTLDQLVKSIQYSHQHSEGNCSNPSWAICGPSAPAKSSNQYCLDKNNRSFTIATPESRSGRINTAFPVKN